MVPEQSSTTSSAVRTFVAWILAVNGVVWMGTSVIPLPSRFDVKNLAIGVLFCIVAGLVWDKD